MQHNRLSALLGISSLDSGRSSGRPLFVDAPTLAADHNFAGASVGVEC
jgi:hypothetical protein